MECRCSVTTSFHASVPRTLKIILDGPELPAHLLSSRSYVLLLSVASVNVAGSTKKAIATGAIFVGYNVGNIIGP